MEASATQSIVGDNNVLIGQVNAQGDVNFYPDDAKAAEVNLDGYASGVYIAPACKQQHLQQALKEHFLIFHGGQDLHLPSYIKHIASCILKAQPAFKAVELQRGTGSNRSLQETLRELKVPTILLVDDLLPLDIVEDPIAIRELARSSGHYVLCSTQMVQDAWGLPPHAFQHSWQEIPTSNLYDHQVLISFLAARIDTENIAFDTHWNPAKRNLAVTEAAKALGNPSRIGAMVLMLAAESRLVTEERFADILKDASSSKDQFINAWYHRADEKQKLILLAATLFQGLDENQFFKVVDSLIEERWQYRVGTLKALDYCDLDGLRDITKFEQNPGEPSILHPQVAGLEQAILKTIWKGYRRHILAAVPVILNTIEHTIGQGNHKPPLRLRRQMALTLSRLALLAPSEIMPPLKDYAGRASKSLRKVAAQAISNWRDMDELPRMCAVLDEWLATNNNPVAVRYTALMALIFAADQDVPNHLHPEILLRIKRCMKDRAASMKESIKDLIPKLLRNHPLQVAPMMIDEVLGERNTLEKQDLITPIAVGLAFAAMDYPQQIIPYLHRHLDEAVRNLAATGQGRQHSHRDRKLVVILETYLKINYAYMRQQLNPAELLKNLAAMRPAETQPFVRGSMMEVILHLMQLAHTLDRAVWVQLLSNSIFEERVQLIRALGKLIAAGQITVAEPYFDLIVKDVSQADYNGKLEMLAVLIELWPIHYQANPDECIHFMSTFLKLYRTTERIHFVRTIGEIYLNARQATPGGDFMLTVGAREIPIFLQKRPLTRIEQQMMEWLSSSIRQCRKTSLLAWMEFARVLEIEEQQAIAQWRPPTHDPFQPSGTTGASQEVYDESPEQPQNTGPSLPQLSPQYLQTAIPIGVRLVGCLCVLFAPPEERKRFWQAVQVIYGRPKNYGLNMVRHTMYRLNTSNLEIPKGLGNRLTRLRQWVSFFSANI